MAQFPFLPACVLAPMEGVTNAAVREVLASYGPVGLVCTEFVRISGGRISRSYLARQVEKLPGVPLSVQVMGNDPELMAEAGLVVARAGADVVDLNRVQIPDCIKQPVVAAEVLRRESWRGSVARRA
ncbi:MAG: tRNA-dihydrouridine synthase [Polyangiaceae bacterium]